MTTDDSIRFTWRKSTRSSGSGDGSGDCVEVALTCGGIGLRDSKDPNGPVLTVSSRGWTTFVAAIKARAFDLDS